MVRMAPFLLLVLYTTLCT